MTLPAVRTIAELELRQRIRSSRWKWTLAFLFAVVSAIVLGSLYVTVAVGGTYDAWSRHLMSISLAVVLFVGLIGAPTLSATSINGDRRDATLAVVQATPITPWELALGKLLGSWLASLVFIALAFPYLIWGVVTAPNALWASILAIVVTALLLGCYCAVGLGFSALSARPAASAMLTQATVLLLLIGLPALFGALIPSVTQEHTVIKAHYEHTKHGDSYESTCTDTPQQQEFLHTERTWWLLAPNPVLIVADALATGESQKPYVIHNDRDSPGGAYMLAVAESTARAGDYIAGRRCDDTYAMYMSPGDHGPLTYQEREDAHYGAHIGQSWYIGLAVSVVLGVLGFLLAVRRLRVPATRLPRGVRVA